MWAKVMETREVSTLVWRGWGEGAPMANAGLTSSARSHRKWAPRACHGDTGRHARKVALRMDRRPPGPSCASLGTRTHLGLLLLTLSVVLAVARGKRRGGTREQRWIVLIVTDASRKLQPRQRSSTAPHLVVARSTSQTTRRITYDHGLHQVQLHRRVTFFFRTACWPPLHFKPLERVLLSLEHTNNTHIYKPTRGNPLQRPGR